MSVTVSPHKFFGFSRILFRFYLLFSLKKAGERLFTHQIQSFVVTNMTSKTVRIMLAAGLGETLFQFSEVNFPKESNWRTIGKFLFKRWIAYWLYDKG
jgi:hypothetical protein